MGSNPVLTKNSDIAPVSSKKFLDIQATIDYRFTHAMSMWNDNNTQYTADLYKNKFSSSSVFIIYRASRPILKDAHIIYMLEIETDAISKAFSRQHIIHKSYLQKS